MENVLYEASLESSYVYKSFNVSNGVIEKIVKCIKTGVPLDKEYIEEQYFQIKKTVISPLSVRVLEAFDKTIIPFFMKVLSLQRENANLIKQRDLLLPRLMSGKLEV